MHYSSLSLSLSLSPVEQVTHDTAQPHDVPLHLRVAGDACPQGRSQDWNIEGANLLMPTIRRDHILLMSNINNEIRRFYV